MKILYIVPSLDNKAPICLTKELADYFYDIGNDVSVAYFDDIVKVHFKCKTIRITMKTVLDFDNYEIIHTHLRRPDLYMAKNHSSLHHACWISTIHCDIIKDLGYTYGSFAANLFGKYWISKLKKAAVTVQVSPYMMQLYEKIFEHNILVCNGVRITKKNNEKYDSIIKVIQSFKQKNYKVLVSYSGIIKRKGIEQVIESLTIGPDYVYVCIGDGEMKKPLKKMADKLKVTQRIFFFDFIQFPYNILKEADVFIISSYSESFCLALYEAILMRCPVVCSRIPAFVNVFDDSEVSYFELNNSKSIIKACERAINNNMQIEAAYEKVINKFSVDNMLCMYKKLYGDLVQNS